jgi:hypothetical protein
MKQNINKENFNKQKIMLKMLKKNPVWWLTIVIPATWEMETTVQDHPMQKFHKVPSQPIKAGSGGPYLKV